MVCRKPKHARRPQNSKATLKNSAESFFKFIIYKSTGSMHYHLRIGPLKLQRVVPVPFECIPRKRVCSETSWLEFK